MPEGRDVLAWNVDRAKWSPVSGIGSKDTQLTNSQVLAFRATPIAVVPAPGANLANIFIGAMIVSDDTAGAWTESSDNLKFDYADGVVLTGIITGSNLVGGGVQTLYRTATTGAVDPDVNATIRIINTGNDEWGGGNSANTMSIRVWYSIVDAVAFS